MATKGKSLSFRFGGVKIFHLNFQRRRKVGARLNVLHSAAMQVPVSLIFSNVLMDLAFCCRHSAGIMLDALAMP